MNQNIRNFGIVAHIDHGKSTLADRFLELTHTIDPKKMQPQFLDMMELEREKGITIKLQPVRMEYKGYVLNMIDTPGHVDFTYEVSRSLAAIEGVILLVDVLKGIQAQTLMNLELAKKEGLVIIPVINKIDLIGNDEQRLATIVDEVAELLKIDRQEIITISAKSGLNVEKILEVIIEKVPAPELNTEAPLRALIFDFQYDSFKGVIAHFRVREGMIKKGDEIFMINSATRAQAKEVGFFKPERIPQDHLQSGEIGYVALGIKEPDKVKIGDTITLYNGCEKVEHLPGYKEPKAVVFVGIFPEDADDWTILRDALMKLRLNDPSLSFKPESKSALGRGFLCGFLGLLHAEIVIERLKREFNLELMTSAPSVCYLLEFEGGKEEMVCSVMDWPDESRIKKTKEQFCDLKIILPLKFLGNTLELLERRQPNINHLSTDKILLTCEMPFRELMANFYDKLKSSTQGYGSMDYHFLDWRESDLVKLEVLVLGNLEEALSTVVPREKAFQEGRAIVEKLKGIFPSQLFPVPLQAKIGGNIIARETVKARRKDVTAPLYGGDVTRKRKLLEKQKKGKKRRQGRASLRIPQAVLWKMFRTE
ncbi:translation elongation factor 4 [Patescibacteria group bacterium]|nr:translation elongation factor 4 [Patescibacteria group bacterium]MBU4161982.1 translation elongation factor 4 [Patescibacteria group bacterium]